MENTNPKRRCGGPLHTDDLRVPDGGPAVHAEEVVVRRRNDQPNLGRPADIPMNPARTAGKIEEFFQSDYLAESKERIGKGRVGT